MKYSVALSDESLIAGMASGDTHAMTAFVRRRQARVYGLALRVTEDSGLAEEVAQDAFMRAWRYATTYDARRGAGRHVAADHRPERVRGRGPAAPRPSRRPRPARGGDQRVR